MRNFSVTKAIHAPVERVWEILADVERWAEWTPSISSIEPLTDLPLTTGSQVRIIQPKLRPAVWKVTQWEPHSCFAWESAAPGAVVVAEHWLTPVQEGCQLTLKLAFTGMLGGLFGFLSGKVTQRYLNLEANGLKARAEA
ncbi:MAG: SRPBCC family protein [Gammaproteobacteria bacterium]